MRKSRAISLMILGGALLIAGCRSRTFYDSQGKVVPRSQWRDASGNPKQLYDANGNLVPPEEVNAAYAASTSYSSHRRTSSWGRSSLFSGSTRGGFGSSFHSSSS